MESYYSRCGGFVIAVAIDKYYSLLAARRFYDSIRPSDMETEMTDFINDIKNTRFREALKELENRYGNGV